MFRVCLLSVSLFYMQPSAAVDEGNEFYQNGRYDEAHSAYEQSRLEEGDSSEILLNLGLTQLKIEKRSNAIESLTKASEGDDKASGLAHYTVGNQHFDDSKWPEALASYRQALIIDVENEDARYNYELALSQLPPPPPRFRQKPGEPGEPGEPGQPGQRGEPGEPGEEKNQPPSEGEPQDSLQTPNDGRSKEERLEDLEAQANSRRRKKIRDSARKGSGANRSGNDW